MTGLLVPKLSSKVKCIYCITRNGAQEEEIRRRLAIEIGKLNRIWKDRKITKTTKRRLLRTLIFSNRKRGQ